MNVSVGKWTASRAFTFTPGAGVAFGGYDAIYTTDTGIETMQPAGLFIGMMLCGKSTSIRISDGEDIKIPVGRPIIISFAQPTLCINNYHAGEFCAGVGLSIDYQGLGDDIGAALGASIAFLRDRFKGQTGLTVLPVQPALNTLAEQALQIPQDAPFRDLELEAALLQFTARICGAVQSAGRGFAARGNLLERERNRVGLVADYLQANLDRTPSLAELSRLAGVNASTLAENFKAGFGQTIFAFYRDLRLDAARRILRCEGTSVTEAGMRVGFSNAAAFATAYRRRFGHPPSREIEDVPDFDKGKPDPAKAGAGALR